MSDLILGENYFNFKNVYNAPKRVINIKMSESQTKAGNQRKFEKKKFENFKKFENLKF